MYYKIYYSIIECYLEYEASYTHKYAPLLAIPSRYMTTLIVVVSTSTFTTCPNKVCTWYIVVLDIHGSLM